MNFAPVTILTSDATERTICGCYAARLLPNEANALDHWLLTYHRSTVETWIMRRSQLDHWQAGGIERAAAVTVEIMLDVQLELMPLIDDWIRKNAYSYKPLT